MSNADQSIAFQMPDGQSCVIAGPILTSEETQELLDKVRAFVDGFNIWLVLPPGWDVRPRTAYASG